MDTIHLAKGGFINNVTSISVAWDVHKRLYFLVITSNTGEYSLYPEEIASIM